jgi:exopolyphosphatase/guanosine-5'-triphosphate,3'-diphosphate pyrophosphatase
MPRTAERQGNVRHGRFGKRLPRRLAAIDVGSNTILLLVAEHDPSTGLAIIDEAEDQPRLGAGLGTTGRLGEAAIERALQSLSRMRDHALRLGAEWIEAVATAAVREAANGAEFVERARRKGIPVRVISPEAEADLAYRSAAHHFPDPGPTLVADIGGGSMELIGVVDHEIELTTSLPLGAVRLTEMGLPLPRLRDHIRGQLGPAVDETTWTGSQVIGSGGTFANLASMVQARQGDQNMGSIQGVRATVGALEELLAALERMSPAQRREVPGLRPERADIIVAGLTVADELLRWVKCPAVTVNRYGLREGLLLEMLRLPSSEPDNSEGSP